MLARDFQPDRLTAAKEVAGNFISDRQGDRIGLAVFAGEAFTQSPLTTDKSTLQTLLARVRSGVIEDGTAIGNGLATALNRLRESEAKSKVVILLTDGFLGNGSEPWKIPSMNDYPQIYPQFAATDKPYFPYERNPKNGGRYWAVPGTKGMEHRVGGLEKDCLKGSPSSDAKNHQIMTNARREKVAGIQVPDLNIDGASEGEVLVVGWGSTYGHLLSAVERVHAQGESVGLAQFSFINPLPANTARVFSKFKKILVCEHNDGQFANYLRTQLPQFTFNQFNKVEGLPFTSSELKDQIRTYLTK
jgi:2-oxoglutarate ferredoxin oxidoreductase subunit alpha